MSVTYQDTDKQHEQELLALIRQLSTCVAYTLYTVEVFKMAFGEI